MSKEVLLLPKFPVRADRAGNVIDGDGTTIGTARFLFLGQIKTTQMIARHFAASFEMAIALRKLADMIVQMQDAGHDSQARSEALYQLGMLEGEAREALALLDENFKDETARMKVD